MRKFEIVKRLKDELLENEEKEIMCFFPPKRSTAKSAGYDFYVTKDIVCKSHEITMVKTGFKVYMEDDETLLLFNRSSNPKKKGLIILNRCSELWIGDYADSIDNEGEIAGLFYNMLDEDVTLKAGEKMMQGVFVKYGITDDDNADGERTGRFRKHR